MSFYRTYRPQTIDDIDNETVREQLHTLLHKEKKELPHAYLFTGPKGTGKTTAARIIAKMFNCLKLSKREGPCGKCEQCASIARGNNLDVLEIDAASNRGIDEIRSLREQINLAPVSGEYKVYIIDEVHMLTMEAFNALLKTLEEPPQHAIFVLATTDVHKVPPTIQSRCITIAFSRATTEELIHAMSRIVRKEKIEIDKDATVLIAESADGSFRDAAKLLEQVSFHRGKITTAVAQQLLALGEGKLIERFMTSLANRQTKEALHIIGTVAEKGYDIRNFLVDISRALERLLVRQTLGESVDPWKGSDLRDAIRLFSDAFVQMKSVPIPQLPIELATVEYCSLAPTPPIPAVESQRAISSTDEGEPATNGAPDSGLLTLEKLVEHWPDFIASLKFYNHSVAGVLRSARPKSVAHGIVTIEAFYKFHQEKLSETKTREVLAQTLKKLFGEKVKVDVVLGKK